MPGFLSVLLAPSLALAAPPPAPSHDHYGSWVVVCDNTRACEARGLDEGAPADIRVLRKPGAPAAVAVNGLDGDGPTLLDGAPLDPDGMPAASLLERLRAGRRLTRGDRSVPLDGMTAALLRMDAVQAGGPAPTPPRPAWRRPAAGWNLRGLPQATRRGAAAALRAEECGPATDRDEAYQLDGSHALVLLFCAMGAYQGWSLPFVVPRAGPPPQRPVTLAMPSLEPATALTEAGFDPATGTLSTAAKGRGLADCGSSAEWVWSRGAFRPAAANLMERCGGPEPGDWPVLFRTSPAR